MVFQKSLFPITAINFLLKIFHSSQWNMDSVTSLAVLDMCQPTMRLSWLFALVIKELLHSAKDPYIALLIYRSTPLANGYSPAELLMSRKLRTKLPVVPQSLCTCIDSRQARSLEEEIPKLNMKLNFDSHHATKPLPVLQKGNEVRITDRKESGKVQEQVSNHNRSYLVNTLSGTFRRNRMHLCLLPAADPLSPKQH